MQPPALTRRRAAGLVAAAAVTSLIAACVLLAHSPVRRTQLEGVRNVYYKNGNEALYRKIKDL